MGNLAANILEHLRAIDYTGPAAFVIVFLALLAVFRRWSILLVTLLIIALGWGARDLMVMNIQTQNTLVSIPLLIYGAGGLLVVLLCLAAFYKS